MRGRLAQRMAEEQEKKAERDRIFGEDGFQPVYRCTICGDLVISNNREYHRRTCLYRQTSTTSQSSKTI